MFITKLIIIIKIRYKSNNKNNTFLLIVNLRKQQLYTEGEKIYLYAYHTYIWILFQILLYIKFEIA